MKTLGCFTLFPLWAMILIGLGVSPGHTRAHPLDNWTATVITTNLQMNCVTYGNGVYVAYGELGDSGGVLSSVDGQNWTLRSMGNPELTGLTWSWGLTFTGGKFFALGGFGTSGVSTDGTNWTIVTSGLSNARAVAHRPGIYVAVGNIMPSSDDLNAYTSSDGVTWTPRHTGSPNGFTFHDVAYGAGKFAAIGPGKIYTSALGTTWASGNIAGGNTISFYNGIFMVPYVGGTNLISSDGTNWVALNTGLTKKLGKVIFANGLYLARAGVYPDITLATSKDGTNWVHYPQVLPGANLRNINLASDGSRLVTVGFTSVTLPPYSDTSYAYFTDPLVALQMTNSPTRQVVLSGLVGRNYRIEFAETLTSGSNYWQALTNLALPSDPYFFTDISAPNSQRFYRAVLLP